MKNIRTTILAFALVLVCAFVLTAFAFAVNKKALKSPPKMVTITTEQYGNPDYKLDKNTIYVWECTGTVGKNGADGWLEDGSYISYRGEHLKAGTTVHSYMMIDSKHDFEVLARYDYVGAKLVYTA